MLTTIARFMTFVLIILSAAACSLNSENDTPTASDPVPTIENVSPTAIPSNTATYVDDVVGFAIDYPENWQVEATPGSLLQLFSPDYVPGVGGDGFPADHTKIEIIPQHSGDPRSLDEVLDAMRGEPDGPGGRVVSETAITLAGEVTGYRLAMDNMVSDQQPVLLVVINGQLLQVAGYGDTARFDEIVLTLRPWSE